MNKTALTQFLEYMEEQASFLSTKGASDTDKAIAEQIRRMIDVAFEEYTIIERAQIAKAAMYIPTHPDKEFLPKLGTQYLRENYE